jgi:hypothetical protein
MATFTSSFTLPALRARASRRAPTSRGFVAVQASADRPLWYPVRSPAGRRSEGPRPFAVCGDRPDSGAARKRVALTLACFALNRVPRRPPTSTAHCVRAQSVVHSSLARHFVTCRAGTELVVPSWQISPSDYGRSNRTSASLAVNRPERYVACATGVAPWPSGDGLSAAAPFLFVTSPACRPFSCSQCSTLTSPLLLSGRLCFRSVRSFSGREAGACS